MNKSMVYNNSADFAAQADSQDKLAAQRENFHIPQHKGQDVVYFTGNSLGLQPKTTKDYLSQELADWATYGVEGHFLAKRPWFSYHEQLTEKMARIVGALPEETIMMNQLTVNLHLMLVAFYRPTASRYKILCEGKAFPSDKYALQSQVAFHGFDRSAIIEVFPRSGEHTLREQDILDAIHTHKDSLALVMMGGVNYFSGQVFNLKTITQAAHAVGAIAGFDLAHAAGNIQLNLHDWQVDFAVWCSYKYLNSGPGGVAGAFVHQKHLGNERQPMFAGWWGHDKAERFLMEDTFKPIPTAERFQLSNAPILSMAACLASLDLFDAIGMGALIEKSHALTGYLEFIVHDINARKNDCLEIITPNENRGCQLSIKAHGYGRKLYDALIAEGVIPDWREPDVIRCAPVPMYNSFTDIYRFGQILESLL